MLPFNRLFLKTKNVCTGFEIFLKREKRLLRGGYLMTLHLNIFLPHSVYQF